MSVYTHSITVAFLITIMLSFVLFVPWLIYTYRKYSYLSFSKTIIVLIYFLLFIGTVPSFGLITITCG